MTLAPYQAENLAALASVAHGFFGRAGGVSAGLHAGLNVGRGSADNPADVQENRCRIAAWFGQPHTQLCTLYQIHSPRAVVVDAPPREPIEADALVTATPGLILGILTADCAPVLFADAQAGVIAAAHAGWKGAFGGVIEQTLQAMESLGAARPSIRAAIGPCIAQESYEVGEEFIARLCDAAPANARFFIPSARPGHAMFDLPAYVAQALADGGLQHVAQLAMDTCAAPDRFFSYRRATLRREADYGRQLSAIMLKE